MTMKSCWCSSLCVLCMLMLSACSYHNASDDNQLFMEGVGLKDLEGVYRNIGEPEGYLSEILWGLDPSMENVDELYMIDKVEVVSGKDAVDIKAIENDCVVFVKSYVLGRDFKINNGKIEIVRESHWLTRGGDDALLGPTRETVILGLDKEGHGMSRSKEFAAGLVYMIFPIMLREETDARFEKLSNKPLFDKPCK